MVFQNDLTLLKFSGTIESDPQTATPTVEDARTEFKRDVSSGDIERKAVAFLIPRNNHAKKDEGMSALRNPTGQIQNAAWWECIAVEARRDAGDKKSY